LPQALRSFCRSAFMREEPAQKESRALDLGTAPLKRDLQLALYRIPLFVSLIISDQVVLFNIKIARAI
jgi:hypothetical protein